MWKICLVALGLLGSCKEQAAAPPAASDPVQASEPTPAKTAGCHDGVLTIEHRNNRGSENEEVSCEDGEPRIVRWEAYHGEPEHRQTSAMPMAQWDAVWQAVEAAEWKDAKAFCTEEAGEPGTVIRIRRGDTRRELACAGTLSPPFQAILAALATRKPEPAVTHDAGAGSKITTLPFDEEQAPAKAVPQDGVVWSALRWRDRNGENWAVLNHQFEAAGDHLENRRLFVHHWVVSGGKGRMMRKVQDQNEVCEHDNVTDYVDGSLALTDLDGDGHGEITFAYVVDCVSDASPRRLKLLVLENGDKYILRGKTGGRFSPEPAQSKWPPKFFEHATKIWRAAK